MKSQTHTKYSNFLPKKSIKICFGSLDLMNLINFYRFETFSININGKKNQKVLKRKFSIQVHFEGCAQEENMGH